MAERRYEARTRSRRALIAHRATLSVQGSWSEEQCQVRKSARYTPPTETSCYQRGRHPKGFYASNSAFPTSVSHLPAGPVTLTFGDKISVRRVFLGEIVRMLKDRLRGNRRGRSPPGITRQSLGSHCRDSVVSLRTWVQGLSL